MGRLFGCRMCGSCILPETGYICPMTCPKGLRNGPCRGSTPQHCFVDPSRGCVWFRIFRRAEQQGNLEQLLEINAPLDSHRVGCETCRRTYRLWRQQSQGPQLRDLVTNRARFNADWQTFHAQIRQPDGWQSNGQPQPPAPDKPVSRFAEKLHNGDFVISAEIAPPMEPTGERIAHVARCLRDYIDTANFTDNPLGVSRMSGLACTLYSLENDLEPVLQLQTRHRSRDALESEVTGAAVVGVRNILCLTDDIGRLGLGPAPRPEINDLDAVQALWLLRRLRDEGINVAGERVDHRPEYFLGAIASPYAALPHYEAIITEKKIKAGAQFLQTMPIFNLDGFSDWLAALDQRNLLGKVYLIATVALIKNTWHAHFLANEVPGVQIPVEVMTRLEDAADVQEESIQIALNLIANLKEMPEIHGVHILAPYQEELVPRLVQEAGLMSVSSGR